MVNYFPLEITRSYVHMLSVPIKSIIIKTHMEQTNEVFYIQQMFFMINYF